MKRPLVSAIVSTYNSEKYIKAKLKNLLAQTIIDKMEIIVVVSGSQQKEFEIVSEFQRSNSLIKCVKTEERESIYKAWNRGIKKSNGIFITNSNTDDILREDALEILSTTLINNPEVALVYANQLITDIPNQPFENYNQQKIFEFPDFDRFLQLSRCLVGSQPMWRASLHFEDDYWFDEKYEVCGDHEFELKISEKYDLLHLDFVLGTFYKNFKGRENKEYQNVDKTFMEGMEITYKYILRYVENTPFSEIEKYHNKINFWSKFPIHFYLLVRKIKTIIFPKRYYHSLEFIFLLNGLFLKKIGREDKARIVFNRYLKHKNSYRIQEQYNLLSNSKNKLKLNEK